MPHHVIIDGSNLATEGRSMPSLKQLNEAIASYHSDHPDALLTIVVDATFGHRIDPKEVAEFDKLIETNELVAPPAGAVGRGDGFVLSIAQKAHASVLSNDSYQEFHGEYPWLFDEGRLIGGKPVPHVGWVFVNRVPVRGPVSRRSIKEQRVVDKSSRGRGRGRTTSASVSADGPMPVPKAPPPGAVMAVHKSADAKPADSRTTDGRAGDGRGAETRSTERAAQPKSAESKGGDRQGQQKSSDARASTLAKSTNDLLPFLSFVEHFPVGTAVTAVVESYSSHGAYVSIGDVKGYVPLRLMGDPPPRSAREAVEIGETVTLVVNSFAASRRSIDFAVPSMAPAPPPPAQAKPRRAAARKAVVTELTTATTPSDTDIVAAAAEAAPAKASRRTRKPTVVVEEPALTPAPATPEPAAPKAAASRSRRPAKNAADVAVAAGSSSDAAAETPPEAPVAAKSTTRAPRAATAKAATPAKAKAAATTTPGTAASTPTSTSTTAKKATKSPAAGEKQAARRRSGRAVKE